MVAAVVREDACGEVEVVVEEAQNQEHWEHGKHNILDGNHSFRIVLRTPWREVAPAA